MNQPALNFTAPKPGELFDFQTQNYKIYDLLYHGGADAIEVTKASGSLTHSCRISDIREALAPHGWTVMSKRLQGKRIYFYWLAEVGSLPEGLKRRREP
ncbi:MAG: hypothetical protein LLG40_10030 [Deltaproteobacteria bacterium]|nr:hypothetical protein [Deltaproteobacteria bacterium]